ncbi:MAG: nuclear transport factor 2 family protein [Methanosphaera sp.]|uniref:nuclear transport factor 2 family protein n=1 Tax=Methanosphaera sp. ISO3-F5 TaxID=1452353 RepID=UPI002B2584BC|nr:nuclear transport factor 2 family protein [Methanosphaera sp. ISO3-F5]MBR0472480.1 nuclear transport factor 2 family protein [Methanosphaera sp.]WQH64194.1 nuclear transport factor 2 family protein [Methanosphaera sp. ISO3-F5]
MAKHVSLMFDNNFEGVEKEVVDKLVQLQKALLNKDIEKLDELFDDSFLLIRGSGRQETKTEFLKDISEDVLHYRESKIQIPSIKLKENKASIITIVDLRTCLLGVQSIWNLDSKFKLRKIDGDWRFVKWDTSYTPKKHEDE